MICARLMVMILLMLCLQKSNRLVTQVNNNNNYDQL